MTKDDRNEISVLLGKKYSLHDIARAIGKSVSTISEEISRNSVKGEYDATKAEHKSKVRRGKASYRGKKIVRDSKLKKFVDQHLRDGQSPAGIAGRLKHQEKCLTAVSKNTIYRYAQSAYGPVIGVHMPKRKRRGKRKKVTQLEDRVFIDKRPKNIEERQRVGHVEADFIVSGKDGTGVFLTVVDRKIRVAFVEQIVDVSTDAVHDACLSVQERFPEMKSMTVDNDILFQMHQTLSSALKVPIYFCHPYHSWEKGSIENVNKQIRKFIPKGSNLSLYDEEEIRAIETYLNSRFMECLTYKTPSEKLAEHRKRVRQNKKRRKAPS